MTARKLVLMLLLMLTLLWGAHWLDTHRSRPPSECGQQ